MGRKHNTSSRGATDFLGLSLCEFVDFGQVDLKDDRAVLENVVLVSSAGGQVRG